MLRRLVLALAALLLVLAMVIHRREIGALPQAVAQARPAWLGGALLLQTASLLCLAELFRRSLASVAVRIRFASACATLLATYSANLLAPSAGAAGVALWLDLLGRRGAPRPKVAAAVLAASALDLSALGLLVIVAIARASATRALSPIEIVSTALLAAMIAASGGLLLATARRPRWLSRWLAAAQGLARRLVGRWPGVRFDPDWPDRTAVLAGEAARAMIAGRRGLATSSLVALAEHAASASALAAVSLAFGQSLQPVTVVSVYALALLAWVASPVPQGIGVVELALAGALVAAGVPPAPAALTAVAYRGLTFWIPLAIGFVVLWRLETAAARG